METFWQPAAWWRGSGGDKTTSPMMQLRANIDECFSPVRVGHSGTISGRSLRQRGL